MQRTQLRHAHREVEQAKLEALYSDFIAEASRLFGDAVTHQTENFTDLMQLAAMIGRMRLGSDRAVIDAAGSRKPLSRPTWGQTAPFLS
jgi:hypothetical protein